VEPIRGARETRTKKRTKKKVGQEIQKKKTSGSDTMIKEVRCLDICHPNRLLVIERTGRRKTLKSNVRVRTNLGGKKKRMRGGRRTEHNLKFGLQKVLAWGLPKKKQKIVGKIPKKKNGREERREERRQRRPGKRSYRTFTHTGN